MLQAVCVHGGHGLLHQIEAKAPVLHGAYDAHGLFRLPALIGVHAQLHIRPHGRADGGDALHVLFAFLADLDLQNVKALFYGVEAVFHHLGNGVYGDGDVGFERCARPAQQLVEGLFLRPGPEVVEGHVHRRLGGGVVHHAGVELFHAGGQIQNVHAHQRGADVIVHGAEYGAVGVAGDDGGGRRFAVALALVGDDAHDDVAERFHRAQRGLEGPRQRQGDASGLYIEYLQRLCASRK